jgi:hypothetical protein
LVTILFLTHWLACGYRLASDKNNPFTDPDGWVDRYATHNNISDSKSINIGELYLIGMYWSTSQVTLIGSQYPPMQPATIREWFYCVLAQLVSYGIAVYQISTLADLNVHSNKNKRKHELKVDKYLQMFDELALNPAIKVKVHEYLTDQHALEDQTNYQKLLKNLPIQWNGLINMEIFLPFLADVPYLETFIDREPSLMIELCRCVEIQAVPPNSMLYYEGLQGIYRLDKGIVSVEGKIYIR